MGLSPVLPQSCGGSSTKGAREWGLSLGAEEGPCNGSPLWVPGAGTALRDSA